MLTVENIGTVLVKKLFDGYGVPVDDMLFPGRVSKSGRFYIWFTPTEKWHVCHQTHRTVVRTSSLAVALRIMRTLDESPAEWWAEVTYETPHPKRYRRQRWKLAFQMMALRNAAAPNMPWEEDE